MEYIKVVVLGDIAVGKTSALVAYSQDDFDENYEPTIFDNYTANLVVDGTALHMSLNDTTGQEELDRVRALCTADTDVFVICYDLTDARTLENVRTKWAPEIAEIRHRVRTSRPVPWILVGTKLDLRQPSSTSSGQSQAAHELSTTLSNRKPVSFEEGLIAAKQLHAVAFFETSAKTREGICEVFEKAARTHIRNLQGLDIGELYMQGGIEEPLEDTFDLEYDTVSASQRAQQQQQQNRQPHRDRRWGSRRKYQRPMKSTMRPFEAPEETPHAQTTSRQTSSGVLPHLNSANMHSHEKIGPRRGPKGLLIDRWLVCWRRAIGAISSRRGKRFWFLYTQLEDDTCLHA